MERLRRKSAKLGLRLCGRAFWQKKQAHWGDELAVREGLLRTRRNAVFIVAALRYLQTVEEAVILTCKLEFGASISNLIALSGVTSRGGAAVRLGLIWLQQFNSARNAINMYPTALMSDVVEFGDGIYGVLHWGVL